MRMGKQKWTRQCFKNLVITWWQIYCRHTQSALTVSISVIWCQNRSCQLWLSNCWKRSVIIMASPRKTLHREEKCRTLRDWKVFWSNATAAEHKNMNWLEMRTSYHDEFVFLRYVPGRIRVFFFFWPARGYKPKATTKEMCIGCCSRISKFSLPDVMWILYSLCFVEVSKQPRLFFKNLSLLQGLIFGICRWIIESAIDAQKVPLSFPDCDRRSCNLRSIRADHWTYKGGGIFFLGHMHPWYFFPCVTLFLFRLTERVGIFFQVWSCVGIPPSLLPPTTSKS